MYNFLPSVSAAIGHYRPQRDVWKIAIALQAIVRTLVFLMYYRYYKEHVYKWAQYLSNIALVMYVIENVSLMTLSFWTSSENYGMLFDNIRKYNVAYNAICNILIFLQRSIKYLLYLF